MRTALARVALLLGAALLAGCDSDGASFVISGNTQALSVVRDRTHPWAPWQLAVVIRNDPVCQRRHRLKDVSGVPKVELYQAAPNAYILRQGTRWYVTELGACGFDVFKEEPQQPGEPLGTFLTQNGKFVFEAARQADAKGAKGKARSNAGAGG